MPAFIETLTCLNVPGKMCKYIADVVLLAVRELYRTEWCRLMCEKSN
jgi:hypothetical protein